VLQDLPGVGQNLRDHPYVFFLCHQRGQPPDTLKPPYVQVVLRYTASGSSARNDMQIGTLGVDSTYLPADGPIKQGEPCFVIYANIQQALSAGELSLASPDPAVQPALNYNYLAHPWDRERLREAVRRAYRLAQHPAFQDVIIESVGIR
jgi:choline dehydrogenase